jgi:hypothetical protein
MLGAVAAMAAVARTIAADPPRGYECSQGGNCHLDLFDFRISKLNQMSDYNDYL